MFAEPRPTSFDLTFGLFGYRVRVLPWFWLATIVLGWDVCQPWFVTMMTGQNEVVFPAPVFLVLWAAAMFLSILIHELGHAVAFQYFGISSHVVLYHFGGLAVPDGAYNYHGGRIDPRQQILISAAGPAAQLLLASVVALLVFVAGHEIPFGWPISLLFKQNAEPIPIPILQMFVFYLLAPSILWALMNLLPVFPLDGGQIARAIMEMHDPARGMINSLWLSVFVGGGVAVFGLLWKQQMIALLFGLLAFSSYMEVQRMTGRGGGFGGGGFGGRGPW